MMDTRLSETLRRCGATSSRAPDWEADAVRAVCAWVEARGGSIPARGSFAPLLADFRAWETTQRRRPADIRGKDDFARLLVGMGLRAAPSRPTRGIVPHG